MTTTPGDEGGWSDSMRKVGSDMSRDLMRALSREVRAGKSLREAVRDAIDAVMWEDELDE